MTVKKCDRCGIIYNPNDFYISQLKYYFNESPSSENVFNGEYYDLCSDCTKKIIDFIKGEANFYPKDMTSPFTY